MVGQVGVTKLNDWQKCFDDSKKNRPRWVEYLESCENTGILKVINSEDDRSIQDQSWDGMIIYKGLGKIDRIEFKTGSTYTYKNYFLKQNKPVLFETISNIKNNTYSSSIWKCNAEVYAYGFEVDGKIVEPTFIKTHEFLSWFRAVYLTLKEWRYPFENPGKIIAKTNNLYQTESVLIPQAQLAEFIWSPPTYTCRRVFDGVK